MCVRGIDIQNQALHKEQAAQDRQRKEASERKFNAARAQLARDTDFPSTPEESEAYFMGEVSQGEKLALMGE